MPSNLSKLSSSSVESEFPNRSDFERSGSFDSQGSHHSRSRSFNMEDENLKHLTNEEKNALLFLEETLDAFEEDVEEPPVLLSSNFGYYSPKTTEDSHSDNDDIIDLVRTRHNHQAVFLDTGSATTTIPASTIQREEDHIPSEPPIDYPKFLGAIPTPVIIAQKISEKRENLHLSSMSPNDEKSAEVKKSITTSPIGDGHFVFPGPPNGKLNRFPNNINVKIGGKQYNKTIAKAAVNIQERKAQVLANLHGPMLFAEEIDGKNSEQLIRKASFRDVASEQARYEALTKLGLVKEMPTQVSMQTSASTSPVSNGQLSPKFFPPDMHRRLSNEKMNINTQQPPKILTPESNTKFSNEHHVINGQSSSKFFTTETKRVPSKEQEYTSIQQSPKVLSEESKRRSSNEQVVITVQNPPKVLSPELNKRVSNEHYFSNGQNSSKVYTETKKIPSKEQDNIGQQNLAKVMTEESRRRLSNEQESISSILRSEPSSFIPMGKTVVFKGDAAATALDTSKRHSSIHIDHEQKQPNNHQEIKRTYSVARPTGFRSPGITVQFSGRDSSDETRKDALRKLGLLKGQTGQ